MTISGASRGSNRLSQRDGSGFWDICWEELSAGLGDPPSEVAATGELSCDFGVEEPAHTSASRFPMACEMEESRGRVSWWFLKKGTGRSKIEFGLEDRDDFLVSMFPNVSAYC